MHGCRQLWPVNVRTSYVGVAAPRRDYAYIRRIAQCSIDDISAEPSAESLTR